MGINRATPMLGRDILATRADDPGRAMMQYADTNAFRVGNTVVIHQPHQAARTFEYRDGHLILRQSDPELERDALAHLLWADTMYRERRYRMPAAGHGVPPRHAPVLSAIPSPLPKPQASAQSPLILGSPTHK